MSVSVPGYVSSVAGPQRSHYPTAQAVRAEILTSLIDNKDVTYDAFEEDIAVVNIFFGAPTTIGDYSGMEIKGEPYYVRDGVINDYPISHIVITLLIMEKEMNILPIKIFMDVYDFGSLSFLQCRKLKLPKS